MPKPVLWLLLILITASAVGGCWDQREIESLAFVTMSAVDRAPYGDGVVLITHIAKPGAVAMDVPGAIEERPFWVISTSGRTVGEAHIRLREESPRTPFWAHNMHLIVGQRLAEEGLEEVFGFFARDFETRRRVTMMVSRGDDVSELMQAEFELERLPAVALKEMLENNRQFVGTTVVTEVQDFLVMLETEGLEPVVGAVTVTPRPSEGDIRGDMQRDEILRSAIVRGAAVFRGDRLQGWLDATQTRGLQWVRGEIATTKVVIPHPITPERHVTLRVVAADSQMDVHVRDDQTSACVDVRVEAEIIEITAFADPFTDYGLIVEVQRQLAAAVEEEIEAALRAVQGYRADAFGFGRITHARYPHEWQMLRERWNDLFGEMQIDVDVSAELTETGLLMRTTRIR